MHAAEEPSEVVKFLFYSRSFENIELITLPSLTNKNYVFTIEGKKYVIRFPGEGTENFIDRDIEQANCIEGCESYEFEDFYNDDLLKQIAVLLRNIHASSLAFKNPIDLFNKMNCLELYLQEKSISIPSEYFLLRTAFQKYLHLDSFQLAPSHGDPTPSNFTLLNGQLMLFDWEYSGLLDPAYDLAFLFTVMNYS